MAEEDPGQEKTESATPRRLEKAQEEGQIPRSRELNTTVILVAGTAGMLVFGSSLAQSMREIMVNSLSLTRQDIFDPQLLVLNLADAADAAVAALLPFFILLLAVVLLASAALGGWMFSMKTIQPKLSRLSLLEGIKRMFSAKALLEMVKALAKFLVVGFIALLILNAMRQDILAIGNEGLAAAVSHAAWVIAWSALAMAVSMIVIAMVDVPFQIWDHAQKLKMTVQQLRDEMKDTEGKPEIKSRIRQLQRDFARSRMMAAVPKADVVITNPTHYSVALKYDPAKSAAPVVVAKGTDLIALRIREVAAANQVEVMAVPALARAIYHTTELEQQIPAGLYMAVAQVLVYVFQINNYRKGRGQKPHPLAEPDIPENLHYER